MRKAFTLIEIIMVLVIIGILAAVAVPKFSKLTSNSKVASELATASTIQSAVNDVHSDWVISEGGFTWGNNKNQDDVNSTTGYPKKLGDCNASYTSFNWILKSSSTLESEWTCKDNNDGTFTYKGPASNSNSGARNSSAGKPDSSKHWDYNSTDGTFSLKDD